MARDSSSLRDKDWGTVHVPAECKDQQGLSWSYFWERQVFLTPRCCWGCNHIPHSSAADWPRYRNSRPLFQDRCGGDVTVFQKICCKLIFFDVMYYRLHGHGKESNPFAFTAPFIPWKLRLFFGLLFLKLHNPHAFRLPHTPYFPHPR